MLRKQKFLVLKKDSVRITVSGDTSCTNHRVIARESLTQCITQEGVEFDDVSSPTILCEVVGLLLQFSQVVDDVRFCWWHGAQRHDRADAMNVMNQEVVARIQCSCKTSARIP